jgi:zinc transporter ZupT
VFALALVLSVFALAAGLGLVVAGRDRPRVRLAIDGFVLGVVPTLVLAHVLPHLWVELGAAAPGLMATGYVTLWLLERVVERQSLRARVVLPVLLFHSLLDGASLAVAERLPPRPSAILLAALVVHRLPEAMLLGGLLAPRYGLRTAAAGTAVLAIATLAGAVGGHELLRHADRRLLELAVAMSMGALLRVVLHGHAPARLRSASSALSALLGAGLALGIPG